MRRILLVRFCCLALGSLGAAPTSLLAWQVVSNCSAADLESTGRRIDRTKLAQLLQQPNGLEKAATLAAHFSVDNEIHGIMQFDVESAVAQSSLIVVGTVTASNPELIEDGNAIFTKYTMHVSALLKGTVPPNGDVAFYGIGGCVAFGNGTTATISTIAWRYIEVGQSYLVFLYRLPGEDTYSITGGIEGLGKLTSQNGGFELAADLDKGPHHVISDRPKGMTIADLASKIKQKEQKQ